MRQPHLPSPMVDNLGERLLDANRTIRPAAYRGKLQTEIEDMSLPNPVISSHYGNGLSNNTSAITSSSGLRQQATTSTTTASRKPSRICLSSKKLYRR
jgi:hypothetical protein